MSQKKIASKKIANLDNVNLEAIFVDSIHKVSISHKNGKYILSVYEKIDKK